MIGVEVACRADEGQAEAYSRRSASEIRVEGRGYPERTHGRGYGRRRIRAFERPCKETPSGRSRPEEVTRFVTLRDTRDATRETRAPLRAGIRCTDSCSSFPPNPSPDRQSRIPLSPPERSPPRTDGIRERGVGSQNGSGMQRPAAHTRGAQQSASPRQRPHAPSTQAWLPQSRQVSQPSGVGHSPPTSRIASS